MLSQLNEYAQMNFAGHRPGGALAKTSDSAPDPITPTLQAVQNSRFWPALEGGRLFAMPIPVRFFVSSVEEIKLCKTHGSKISNTGPLYTRPSGDGTQPVVADVSDQETSRPV